MPQADVCDEKTTGDTESLSPSHVPITLRAELIWYAFVMLQSLSYKPFGIEWDGYLMIKKEWEKERENEKVGKQGRERQNK